MEAEPLEGSGGPRPPREPPVNTMDGFIRSEEDNHPRPAPCPGGTEASQTRLSRLARPAPRLSGSQKKTEPRPPPAPGSSTSPSRPAATGPIPGPGPTRGPGRGARAS